MQYNVSDSPSGRPLMITAVVQIPLPKPISLEEAARVFE
jgi:hypothetical protein